MVEMLGERVAALQNTSDISYFDTSKQNIFKTANSTVVLQFSESRRQQVTLVLRSELTGQ